MDSLPYSLVDSVLGVWLINLITGARHVLLIIRKKLCATAAAGAGALTILSYSGLRGVLSVWQRAGFQIGDMTALHSPTFTMSFEQWQLRVR